MFLFYGVLVLSVTFLCWSLAMISCRNPKALWYGGEFMQAYVWAPLLSGGLVLGLLLARKSLPEFPPSLMETVLVLVTIAVTAVVRRLMRVKLRLAAYETEKALGAAASGSYRAEAQADREIPSAVAAPSSSADLPKAA